MSASETAVRRIDGDYSRSLFRYCHGLTAAPAGVAKHATVMAMDDKGAMRTLRAGKVGLMYMLAGADAAFYDAYPKNADPDTTVPYVMWAGTPYQHLMVPVK